MTLRTRISLLLTALASCLIVILGALWLRDTRDSIREEITAGTRVAEQWLSVVGAEAFEPRDGWTPQRLLAHLRAAGRIRANELSIIDGAGRQIYVSPPPSYKAGRFAPPRFADIVDPHLPVRRIQAGDWTLVLRPDPSRSILDAWDNLCAMAGWAVALLAALFIAARTALDRTLRPLGQIMEALERTGQGRFDTRLPVYPVRELGTLARAFNGMADRLHDAVNENVRLGSEQELSRLLETRLDEERQSIARELHDELAQGITAVRALAGAILRLTPEGSEVHARGRTILAATGQVQDSARNILRRLRSIDGEGGGLESTLRNFIAAWGELHPEIRLHAEVNCGFPDISDDCGLAVLRIIQESLTNVARHAAASQVQVSVLRRGAGDSSSAGWVEMTVCDNGRGLPYPALPPGATGAGWGIAGMRERVARLGGDLEVGSGAAGGTRVRARLPLCNASAAGKA